MGRYIDDYYKKYCLPQTCPICGKKYIPTLDWYWKIGSYNAYTADSSDKRTVNVCSYSCMRKWEKEQEVKLKNKKTSKKIILRS